MKCSSSIDTIYVDSRSLKRIFSTLFLIFCSSFNSLNWKWLQWYVVHQPSALSTMSSYEVKCVDIGKFRPAWTIIIPDEMRSLNRWIPQIRFLLCTIASIRNQKNHRHHHRLHLSWVRTKHCSIHRTNVMYDCTHWFTVRHGMTCYVNNLIHFNCTR